MNIIKFRHIPGDVNISDMLTKHLEPCVLEPLVKPWLMWRGSKVIDGPKVTKINKLKPIDAPLYGEYHKAKN